MHLIRYLRWDPLNAYYILVTIIVIQRIIELHYSKINEKKLKKRGGIELFPEHYPFMVMLHILWFLACVTEGIYQQKPPPLKFSLFFICLLILSQIVRFHTMLILKERWTTRIFILPGVPPIKKGLYNYFRHPNYGSVIIEIFSLPLVFGLWRTALIFSCANAIILSIRIRAEENALNLAMEMKNQPIKNSANNGIFG